MIEIKELTKVYDPDVKAVDKVNLRLETGEIGCIIGTSGCGKTTTLKMINGLITPTSGEVFVNYQKFNPKQEVEWRRSIGYVIQKAGLLPHLTVAKNISLLSDILKKPKEEILKRVQQLMEIINMPYSEFGYRYPVELSGGQQQRVGIARALMENPPVMLMDEPFGALDPITRESLHDEFLELNKKLKKTILIVTHDLSEAFKLANKVILMDKGQIVQIGGKDDFLKNPANDFVKDFIKGHFHA